jgi:flagellar biosynthesis anti-sigma factor FlgM
MDVRDRSPLIPAMGTMSTEAPGEVRRARFSSPGSSSVAPAADRSEVSAIARTLASAAAQPDVRRERVAQLQQQIASGTYTVAPQDVASAIMGTAGSHLSS